MRLDRITFRILKRKLLAWLRLKFRSEPVVIPKIHIPTRVWGDADERREEALYLAAPNAFWLRPDRGEHDMPCWQIEGEYTSKPVYSNYDSWGNYASFNNCRAYNTEYGNASQIQMANLQRQVGMQQLMGLRNQFGRCLQSNQQNGLVNPLLNRLF